MSENPAAGSMSSVCGRYTLKEAARRVGVHYITLYRWEKKSDFPRPKRLARTNERLYTDELIEAIIQWKDRTIDPPPLSA